MNRLETLGVEALTGAELEGTVGGEDVPAPPLWWWMATFLLSESKDFVEGVQLGYAAATS